MTDESPKLVKYRKRAVDVSMLAIARHFAMDGLAKSQDNKAQHYKFRGIDDVMSALSPLLAAHDLLVIPRSKSHKFSEFVNAKKQMVTTAIVEIEYTLRSVRDGSENVSVMFGEASDYGDKATAKANSFAYKYFAIHTFCIPVEGMEDADKDDLIERNAYAGAREPTSDFPGDRPTRTVAPPDPGPMNANQAKKSGVWEKILSSMKLQRTEEELLAWAKHPDNERDLASLPSHWKTLAKEEFSKLRADLRESDRRLADRRFNPQTGEVNDSEEWDSAGSDDDGPTNSASYARQSGR